MGSKILVVDDEREIADVVELYLKNENYQVVKCCNGRDALEAVEKEKPDLALLDVMLPDIDGFTILQKIREKYTFPVIMLTAKAEELDRILGLEVGADDYLTKPFYFREMVSRVRAHLRRREWEKDDPTVRRHGKITIYLNEHRVTVDGKNLALSPKEYDILSKLMEKPSWVMTREQLLTAIWGADFDGEARTVDMHMTNLRRKLDEAGAKDYIQTVRAVGYKMCTL